MRNSFKEFYISSVGKDDNPGTKEAPFATLGRAKQEVIKCCDDMDGDVVVNIAPGYYPLEKTEVFDERCSGKNGYNVVFRGTDKNNPPIFSGGTKITGWKKCPDGKLWCAETNIEKMRTLYINGFPAQRAVSRYLYEPIDVYHEEGSSHFADGLIVSAENFRSDIAHPEELELVWPLMWTHQRTPVEDFIKQNDKVIIKMKQPCFDFGRTKEFGGTNPAATNEPGSKGKRFYLENALELLDEPGEFYFSKTEKKVYYYPFSEENLEEAEVYTGTTEFMLKIAGATKEKKVHNLIFDNLEFRYGAWNGVTEEGLIGTQVDLLVTEVNGLVANYGKPLPAQIEILNAEDFEMKNCRIASMGSSAISMCHGVKNAKIIGNRITDISGTGILIDHWDHRGVFPDYMERCENIVVSNNVIHRAATEFRGMTAITIMFPKNVTVSHNDIKRVPYTGISFGWGWGGAKEERACNNHVEYNRIEDVTSASHDGGHIYTLDTLKDAYIRGNYLIKAEDYRGGIYLDSGTRDVKILDNVIEDSEQWFFARAFVGIERIVAYGNYFEEGSYADLDHINVVQYDNICVPHDKDGRIMWPQEALEIIDFAGLDNEYQHLLEGTEFPEWRKDVLDYQPKAEFANEKSTWVNATAFIDGAGEGSAYHTMDGKPVRLYTDCYGSALNETNPGDWLKYDIYVTKTDEYRLQIKAADREEVTKIAPKVNLYIDEKLIVKNAELTSKGFWLDVWRRPNIPYPIHDIGTARIEKGAHTVKIEFIDNTPSFEAWRFYNESILSELVYDEGIMQ